MNRAKIVQFSPHETAAQKAFWPTFFMSIHIGLSSLTFSRNVHPVFKCPESASTHLRGDSFHRVDNALFFQISDSDSFAVI
jgi:hypothetical protein